MNLREFTSGTPDSKPWLDIVCDTLTCNNVTTDNIDLNTINGFPYLRQDAGTYDANISVTGCINVVDSQNTHYTRVGNTYQIFGFFRGDVQAVNKVTLELDVVPGSNSSLSNRSFYLMSNKNAAGAKAFVTSSDGNTAPNRLSLGCNTFDQSNAVAANQVDTTFYYELTYMSS